MLKIYSSLLQKSWLVEVSEERIHLVREVSCWKNSDLDLVAVLNNALEEVGEKCSLSFSGSYELGWYVE
ncbi:MAG: hypothetical protein RMI56_05340 [Sulfolobales archaeon]|nr:hypothetical protein [Sulfolobales archaeon]MDW8083204.1 hypothetical protein [Sulfolobales archaeon]